MYDAVLDSTFVCIKAVKYALIYRKNKTYCCQKVRKRKYFGNNSYLLVKVGVNCCPGSWMQGLKGYLFIYCLLIRDFMCGFFVSLCS